ncbi:flagellar brake domain-containing protein, partial [Aliivibrio kagoshimensis]|uniref:flagellar brake domain-containing protein n=1 Tax=Aliivibrio kagoshimensis TaxID=2910230 RepID=UPI003D0B95C1
MEASESIDVDKVNREKITTGPSGLNMIFKSTLVHISITTPLGERLKCNTLFIGSDSQSYLLLKFPAISLESQEHFLQEGFKLTVKAISGQGEGSIILFRTLIQHVILQPIPILIVAMPSTMKLHQLRREPRFEVDMKGIIHIDDREVQVKLRDLSNNGCSFMVEDSENNLHKDKYIILDVISRHSTKVVSVLNGNI